MKKLLTVLLTLLMLAGCGGTDDDKEEVIAMQNVNVRQAMSYALDRAAIATALNDGSIAAEGIIPYALAGNPETGADFRDDNGAQVSYDLAKAQEYYAAACEELGEENITLTLLYGTDEGDAVIKAAEQIASYLEETGFTVVLDGKPKKERLALMTDGDYDVALTRWGPDYGDPQTYMDLFVSTNTDNNSGRYDSEKYDELVAKAEDAATTPADRWQAFLDAEKVLVNEDAGNIPVYQAGGAMLINPEISGIQFHSAAVDNYRHVVGKEEITLVSSLDVISMDQAVATDGTSYIAQTMCLAGLMELDENNNPVLDLAESYEVSDDGLVYTFKIRDDAYWSNGEPVTANDFVYAWKRMIDPEMASEYAFMMATANIVGASSENPDDLGVEAIDDKTFQVTLSAPSGFFLSLCAFPTFFPLNEEFVEAQGDQYALSADNMLFCGPYVLSNWTAGYSFEFELNDSYWNYDAYVEAGTKKIAFRVIADTQTALLQYQKGELDTVSLAGEQVEANKDEAGFVNRLQGYLYYLSININHRD